MQDSITRISLRHDPDAQMTIAKRREDATLLDVLIDGFEKNEIFDGFHRRALPMPDEESASERFSAFVTEAEPWKGPRCALSTSPLRGSLFGATSSSCRRDARSSCASGAAVRCMMPRPKNLGRRPIGGARGMGRAGRGWAFRLTNPAEKSDRTQDSRVFYLKFVPISLFLDRPGS